MKRDVMTVFQSFVVTVLLAFSVTFAQGSTTTGFFGDMSAKIYCTFSNYFPGTFSNSNCRTNVTITDNTNDNQPATSTQKAAQVSGVVNRGFTAPRTVYVQGPAGRDGTTTIIYQSIPGSVGASPAAYIYAGGNTNTNPFQTTVPGDIHSTFIHHLQFEDAKGNELMSTYVKATNTDTDNLNFRNAFGGNLTATGTISTLNLTATSATITDATTTTFFASLAQIMDLFARTLTFVSATGTDLQVANASTTNLAATGTVQLLGDTYVSSTTIANAEIQAGNATVTSVVSGNATSTNLFSTYASITEATTTNFFSVFAYFLNLGVDTLTFLNATGTNLQVSNASTTNFTATGTVQFTGNTYIASTTILNGNIQGGNATVTSLVAGNSTSTNLFATRASVTNATTTSLFASLFTALSASITNLISTNATLTNATITNLRVENCAEGDVLCNGGNDTGAIVGTDAPLVLGTLNAGNINFITGDLGAPSVTPGTVKLTIETGLPAEGSGAVRVTNSLKVGGNIVASGTATVTNLYATGTFAFATGTIASTTANWINVIRGFFAPSATITNGTSTNWFSGRFVGNTASFTNATTTNFFADNASLTDATTTTFFSNKASITNATSTNIFANVFRSFNASIDRLTTQVMNVGTLNATTSVNTLVLNASTTNASTTNTINLIGTNATFTNATTSAFAVGSIRPAFGNATVTINASLVPGLDSAYDLGSASNKWRDLWVSSSTIHIGNASLSVNASGTLLLNGVSIVATTTPTYAFATLTSATSSNLFATLFNAVTGTISNLFATNATITNATTTNFASVGNFSLATGTIASTTIANANVTNLFAKNLALSSVDAVNATTTNLNLNTITGRASSSTFGANTAISSVDLFTVFNITASASSLTFTLATPTNITAGRVLYVNNVGSNSFTMYGSTITADSGRTFVWTGTKWSIGADGVGTASTSTNSMTIIHQALTADYNMSNDTLGTIGDLSWNVAARDTWYYVITGVVTGGDNSNNGMKVQVTSPSGSTACSSSLTNFDLDNHWTTATCNGTISGTSNWSSPNNFRVEGVFSVGATGGSARFNVSKNTNSGATLTLVASSTVLTAYKISGADLAEVYYSANGPISLGEIVSLDGTGVSQVTRSTVSNDSKALGIVSTKPGTIIGDNDGIGSPVVVGLSGRVPVKVTTKNGEIKAGDFITTSDIPGVGMKATEDGRVVGKALTSFNGEGIGMVYVFIQNTYYEGDADNGIYSKIQNGFKASLEKLSDVYLEMVLKVDKLTAREVQTDRLCIGQTCIEEQDLKDFLEYKKAKETVIEEVVPPAPTETQTEPGAVVPEVTETTTEVTAPISSEVPEETIEATEIVIPVEETILQL